VDGVFSRCYESAPLCQWLVRLRASGRVGRCSGRDLAMPAACWAVPVDVVERLPLSPPAPLARLAADLFGDSHALDLDRDLGRLAVRAVAAWLGIPPPRTRADLRAIGPRPAWFRTNCRPRCLSSTCPPCPARCWAMPCRCIRGTVSRAA